MYEISPLIQAHFNGNSATLDVLTEGIRYEIDDFRILQVIPLIADHAPNRLDTLAKIVVEEGILNDSEEAEALLETLVEYKILVGTNSTLATKAGVQYWVDHGWVDALVLHLSSRNIKYIDDPVMFGGEQNIIFSPNIIIEKQQDDNPSLLLFPKTETRIDAKELISGILRRRSFEAYKRKSFGLFELGDIMWHANQYARHTSSQLGEGSSDRELVFDSAFSALKTFIIVYENSILDDNSTAFLPAGLYKYNVTKHGLESISCGDHTTIVTKIAIGQRRAGKGLFSLMITGDWSSYSDRYNHERSYRNLLINVSELAQYYLVLCSMNKLSTFMTPAIQDEDAFRFIQSKKDLPLYLIGAG